MKDELKFLSEWLQELDDTYVPASHDPREIKRALIGSRYCRLKQPDIWRLMKRLESNIYAAAPRQEENQLADTTSLP